MVQAVLREMKKVLIAGAAALVIIIGLWFIALPQDLILSRINATLKEDNLSLEIPDFRKGLFFTFHAPVLRLKRGDTVLLTIGSLRGSINPAALVLRRLPLSFSGNVGGGAMEGHIDLLHRHNSFAIVIDKAGIEQSALLSTLGLSGNGVLSGSVIARERCLECRFEIREAHVTGALYGLPIPPDFFHIVRGLIRVDGGDLGIESLWMEGQGLNARLKGTVKGRQADLTLEIMKDSSFVDSGLLLQLIERYKVSPGYYVVPVKGELRNL